MSKKHDDDFVVQPHHGRGGRVFKPIGDGVSILVATRGDVISRELAEECGLIEPEPKATPPTTTLTITDAVVNANKGKLVKRYPPKKD